MSYAIVKEIWICPVSTKTDADAEMQTLKEVIAMAQRGLKNDRYCKNDGRYQKKGECGKRQVTLMDTEVFKRSKMKFSQTRRNILIECHGFDINRLINKDVFPIGEAWIRVIDYCYPCGVPGKNFPKEFHNNGGVIAEIINSGRIAIGDRAIPPWALKKK